MASVATTIRRAAPTGAKRLVRKIHREILFRRAVARFARYESVDELELPVVADLVYGWGNQWAADAEYLEAVLRTAWATRGPILECGSGLTTLLMGLIVNRTGSTVDALEHMRVWADRVERLLARYGARRSRVRRTDLRSYGEYSWYGAPPSDVSRPFELVVCDGPPESTPGGRYGMLPVMRDRLAAGCVILVDDVHRERDAAVLERWCRELGVDAEPLGRRKSFARLVIPGA